MTLRRWINSPWGWTSPFEELEQMKAQMNRLAQGFTGRNRAGVFPLINVTEDKDNYFVRAELPGLNTDDLDISVTGSSVAISGERKIPGENKEAKYHRREREAGKFSRIVSLPNQINGEKVDAKLVDGVLTIVLPKAESAKPRQISVG